MVVERLTGTASVVEATITARARWLELRRVGTLPVLALAHCGLRAELLAGGATIDALITNTCELYTNGMGDVVALRVTAAATVNVALDNTEADGGTVIVALTPSVGDTDGTTSVDALALRYIVALGGAESEAEILPVLCLRRTSTAPCVSDTTTVSETSSSSPSTRWSGAGRRTRSSRGCFRRNIGCPA